MEMGILIKLHVGVKKDSSTREPLLKGRLSIISSLYKLQTSLDQLIFIYNIVFFTKQATLRMALTVVSLPLQLVISVSTIIYFVCVHRHTFHCEQGFSNYAGDTFEREAKKQESVYDYS
jgi:hypothetical protein